MRLYAGFDCGGTSTRCLIATEEGHILGSGAGGPSNYLFCGKELARESVENAVKNAFSEASLPILPFENVFVASAAVEVFCGSAHEAFYKDVISCGHLSVDSDIIPVWYAGTVMDPSGRRPVSQQAFRPAISMIAGTGSVAYRLNRTSGDGEALEGTYEKAGGWGPQIGDEGSGFWIGIRALTMAAQMADQRIPMDQAFYQTVLSHYGVSSERPRSLWRAVNTGDFRSQAASVTRKIEELCVGGDRTADRIFGEAADELAKHVRILAEKDAEKQNVSEEIKRILILSGGLLREGSPLKSKLEERVSGLVSDVVQPQVSAAQASCAIALSQDGLDQAAEALMTLQ